MKKKIIFEIKENVKKIKEKNMELWFFFYVLLWDLANFN